MLNDIVTRCSLLPFYGAVAPPPNTLLHLMIELQSVLPSGELCRWAGKLICREDILKLSVSFKTVLLSSMMSKFEDRLETIYAKSLQAWREWLEKNEVSGWCFKAVGKAIASLD